MERRSGFWRIMVPLAIGASLTVGIFLPIRSEGAVGGPVWTHVKFCYGTSGPVSGCRTGGCACASYVMECFCLATCYNCGCVSFEGEFDGPCPGEIVVQV